MNLKERGITVGDLIIIILIILTSTTIIKAFNKNKKSTFNHLNQSNQELLIYMKTTLLNNHPNKFLGKVI